MKYALCLFGLIRSFEKIFSLILNNFKLNENDKLDIFISTSNYNNKKYRFCVTKDEYLDINDITNKIKQLVGNKLKYLNVNDEKCKKYNRCDRIIDVLTSLNTYCNNNDIKYDKIILHRMDVIFVTWEKADMYYEDRKEGIPRKKGILYGDFKFPIGVKEHGCCSIQNGPEYVDAKIDLTQKLNINEILCYEDYWIGHVPIDFIVFNDNLINNIIIFYQNYKNNIFLNTNRIDNKINSHQSHDSLDKKWWEYKDSKITSMEVQIKLFFEKENIKLKQLRYMQDISVLYIR